MKDALREVRLALLEADVNYGVAKNFVAKIREKALGEHVISGVNPTQQFIKIVNDETCGSTRRIKCFNRKS